MINLYNYILFTTHNVILSSISYLIVLYMVKHSYNSILINLNITLFTDIEPKELERA